MCVNVWFLVFFGVFILFFVIFFLGMSVVFVLMSSVDESEFFMFVVLSVFEFGFVFLLDVKCL